MALLRQRKRLGNRFQPELRASRLAQRLRELTQEYRAIHDEPSRQELVNGLAKQRHAALGIAAMDEQHALESAPHGRPEREPTFRGMFDEQLEIALRAGEVAIVKGDRAATRADAVANRLRMPELLGVAQT